MYLISVSHFAQILFYPAIALYKGCKWTQVFVSWHSAVQWNHQWSVPGSLPSWSRLWGETASWMNYLLNDSVNIKYVCFTPCHVFSFAVVFGSCCRMLQNSQRSANRVFLKQNDPNIRDDDCEAWVCCLTLFFFNYVDNVLNNFVNEHFQDYGALLSAPGSCW